MHDRTRPRMARRTFGSGVTLFEILIVVAIMALVAAGVGLAVFKHWIEAREKIARTNARDLRSAVKVWQATHETDVCPEIEQLVKAGTLDRDSPLKDPWGGEWQLQCENDDVTVISLGRDHKSGTEDDIRVPPA